MKIIRPGTFTATAACDKERMNYDARNEQLGYLERCPDVVFIGDENIRYYTLDLYYGDFPLLIINRGAEEDTPEYIAKRFYADCVQLHPKVCIYLAGARELPKLEGNFWVSDPAVPELKVQDRILSGIRDAGEQADQADITMAVCSLLPAGEKYDLPVQSINEALQDLCEKKNWIFVDLYAAFHENGHIRKECSHDGLTLSFAGYNVMTQLLKKAVFDHLT